LNYIVHIPRPDRLVQEIRTRLRPPEITSHTVHYILDQYGLELRGTPRNLTAGKRNRNLILKTSSDKQVLKQYWHGWPTSFIVHEHSILVRLANLNFPAPQPLTTLDGSTFVSLGEHNYALFKFETGQNYAASFLLRAHRLHLMGMAGRTLASFHRQLEGFVPQGRHYTGFRSYTGDRWRDMAWHINKVNELREKSQHLGQPDKDYTNWLCQQSHYILDELGRLDDQLCVARLPRLLIHGDYGLHNLHFHRDGTVAPLDFESCRLEWRLRDVLTSLARFRYNNGDYDRQSMDVFLNAYVNLYPLEEVEWRLLPQVWRYCKLQDAVKYWNSYFETGGPARKLLSARQAVEQAEWALAHAHEVLQPS
jgi:Ser/Thr protein kinase RdoA (MazF antagonist)